LNESIRTRDSTFRKAILAREKLAATLRILATVPGKPEFSEGEKVVPKKCQRGFHHEKNENCNDTA